MPMKSEYQILMDLEGFRMNAERRIAELEKRLAKAESTLRTHPKSDDAKRLDGWETINGERVPIQYT